MAKARQSQKSRGSERSDYQAQTGRADARGKAFQPGQVVAMAPASDLQFNRPRPSPTRYPISHDVFLRIKTAARTAPRPKIARYMTSAMSIPIVNSRATEIAAITIVLRKSCHHSDDVSTVS